MLMLLVERVKCKIKELMQKRGMTVYELAKKADVTEACIRNWYTKRNYTPSLEALEKICHALDIPVSELVRTEDEELVPISSDEKKLLNNWRMLDEKKRNLLILQIDMFLSNT